MRIVPSRLLRSLQLVGLTGACLFVLAWLMPALEQGLTEARFSQAWIEVRRMSRVADASMSEDTTPSTDPWGRPYVTSRLSDGSIRVLSMGPNRTTSDTGPDEDDVYSDMPVSPLAQFERRRLLEAFAAFGVAGGLWFVLVLLWRREGRRIRREVVP